MIELIRYGSLPPISVCDTNAPAMEATMPRIAFTLVGTSATTIPMLPVRMTFRPESGTCVSAASREPVRLWLCAPLAGAAS